MKDRITVFLSESKNVLTLPDIISSRKIPICGITP
jgi:hypothetical protein